MEISLGIYSYRLIPPPCLALFSCSSLFFSIYLFISHHFTAFLFIRAPTYSVYCKFVYMRLPKCHWQLQIKMGGACAALFPLCNAKVVECHKSPFDLSNQVRPCCMQTFVIAWRGRGASALFCPCASSGCRCWSLPKVEGMGERWKERGRKWRRRKLSLGCRPIDKENERGVCCSCIAFSATRFHYFCPVILAFHVRLRARI